jgi:hypothetical protein
VRTPFHSNPVTGEIADSVNQHEVRRALCEGALED